MARLRPDPSFYPSPKLAMEAPRERLAYVALLSSSENGQRDALAWWTPIPRAPGFGRLVGRTDFPQGGNELHHFGWNACSSHLCPCAANAHVERRYLLVPGTHSSRIHILDTQPDPRQPALVKVIEGDEVMRKTGYAAPHTVHCGPDGIYLNALGAPDGNGPGGIFTLDHETFDVKGRWEQDRGPQYLAYDFFWHLGHDTMITSEWGTPNMVKEGVNPELLLAGKYGRQLHVWDLRKRTHLKTIDLGAEQQMVLELRPAHDPTCAYGFVGVVFRWPTSPARSSSGTSTVQRKRGEWKARKVITIPASPRIEADLPPLLKGFKAVPPLVTDINLSLDDRFLYVSCYGTGELLQYDVRDPFNPVFTGSVKIGGIVARSAHPRAGSAAQRRSADGGGQPRRPASLRHQLALHSVGRPVLPRRYQGVDGEGRCGPWGWHCGRSEVLRPVRGWASSAPGAASGRRRLLRLLLLLLTGRTVMTWTWWALSALGAGHGLNPGMGWLFAVALGMQEKRSRAVWRSLPPLALGHALAIAAAALAAAVMGQIVPIAALKYIVAASLLVLALSRSPAPTPALRRHAGRISELATWSFLMATAHGAGLMVVPLLVRDPISRGMGAHARASPPTPHSFRYLGSWTRAYGPLFSTPLATCSSPG